MTKLDFHRFQINVETGTQRFVLRLEIPNKKEDGDSTTQQSSDQQQQQASNIALPYRLSNDQAMSTAVVRCCTRLLSSDIDTEAIHATMRLLLRLTRSPPLAVLFVEEGGPQALLSLTHKSHFVGFTSLCSLLFRHVLEEGDLLQQAVETMVRTVISGTSSSVSREFKIHGPACRDFDYVLRFLSPVAYRDDKLFFDTAAQVLRLANLPPKPEDYASNAKLPLTPLKYVGSLHPNSNLLSPTQKNLINLLIDQLCISSSEEPPSDANITIQPKMDEETTDSSLSRQAGIRLRSYSRMSTGGRARRNSYRRQLAGNDDDDDLRSEDMVLDNEPAGDSDRTPQNMSTSSNGVDQSAGPDQEVTETKETGENEKQQKRLLFSQAAILRLLAELIESYPACGCMIVSSTKRIKLPASGSQVSKEVSILAYVLDNLLPASYTQGNSASQVAKLSKTFVQCLASTNLPTDTLTNFANEYRSALSRTLALPESQYKHYRVRSLAGLTAQIVEPQGGMTTRSISNPSQFVRMLIRKGFITDLAKAVYSLDLNSPMLITTVNTLLKPMESLTKIVSHFVAAQKRAAMVGKQNEGPQASRSNQQPSSASRDRPRDRQQGERTALVGESPSQNSQTASQTPDPSNTNQPTTPQEMSSSVLGGADNSLIPLQPEEQEDDTIPEGPPPELLQEAMSLGFDIGRRRRRELNEDAADHPDDMDIDDIVDELLVRDPTARAQIGSPGQIFDVLESGNPHESDASSDILSHSDEEDMEPDNYNSAGEEIEDEEFDESRAAYTVPPREEVVESDHISDVDSHSSSDEADQDDDEEEGMALDSDQEEEQDDDEEEERESFNLVAEEEEGNVTYDLAEEEEEDDDLEEDDDEDELDEDDELNFETYEDGAMEGDHDYVHVSFPWELGWHDMHPLEHHHYYAGSMAVNSPLGRAYHLRAPGSLELDLSPSTRPTLPQQHPLLLRGARQGGSGSVGAQHTDGMPRDNIVQQMLTNISSWVGSEEVLSLNMGGGTPPRTNAVRGGAEAYINTMTPDEDMESTVIPDLLSRWREESQALDQYAATRCIAMLRNNLLKRLVEIYNKEAEQKRAESKEKSKASAQPKATTSQDHEVPVGPNPSDEATPLVATPRTTSSSVEQLQSSLRAVADALAQTVVQVRSARHLMELGPREDSDALASTREREEGQEPSTDQTAENAPTAQPDTPQTLSSATQNQSSVTSSPSTSVRGVRSLPDLSNFDGTQESARSILANTSRSDPLYIFLSAIAGAPAPPLPESTELSQTPPISQSSSSPRLPVFTQLQNSSNVESPSALPVSVIQDHRTTPPSQTSINSSSSTEQVPTTNPHELVNPLSTASEQQPHSQTPQSLESVPSHVSQSVLAAGNLADVLAVELARAISSRLPNPADETATSSASQQVPSSSQPIHAQDQTNQTLASNPVSTGSSSPSDTLAPILASLQMPPPPSQPQDSTTQDQREENHSVPVAAEMQVDISGSSSQSVVVETSQSSQTGSTDAAQTSSTETVQTGSSTGTPSTQTSSAETHNQTGGSETSQAGSSQTRAVGEGGFPEEIDPTFLAALPDVIRQEVVAQFEREQRQRQQQRQQQEPSQQDPSQQQQQQQLANVSPDFLAALPLDIQEEVLQQQRWERARQVSQSVDPALPTDAGNFLQSLPSELRRTILSDVDDAVLNQLPDSIAQEARTLQEERIARRRWLEEERLAMRQTLFESGRSVPSYAGFPMDPALRYAVLNLNSRDIGRMRDEGLSAIFNHAASQMGSGSTSQSPSKQMLDQEGLCCLLVFLFLDQSKLHFNRLFRIFRSLCQHLPTRAWLLSSLFAILSTANEPSISHTCPAPPPLTPSRSSAHPKPAVCSTPIHSRDHPTHWLNMTINAALGSHAPMFQFNQLLGKSLTPTAIRIHPHASSIICNNVLDLLVFLARQFPSAFLPVDLLPKETRNLSHLCLQPSASSSNFWQLLLKLDNSTSRKGKGSNKSFTVPETTTEMSESDLFSCSPFGQLMGLFSHRIIQNSLPLVDKLIRALSVIAGTIPKQGLARREKAPDTSLPKATDSKDKEGDSNAYTIYESCTDIKRSLSGSLVSVELLQSAVSLLISGKCSEDCLEDATTFLINLSRCSGATRDTILFILLEGVQKIGQVLSSQITCLLNDILASLPKIASRRQNSIPSSDDSAEEPMSTGGNSTASSSSAPMAAPSLGSVSGVVLPTLTGARPTVDHSHDLHLPSMTPLTGKVSQQSFFLRLLKVICQLREAAMLFSCKTTPIPGAFLDTDPPASSFLARIMTPSLSSAALINNDDAGNQNEPGATQNETATQPGAAQSETGNSQSEAAGGNQNEATGATAASTSKPEPSASKQFTLPPLSMQLDLETLWGVLSDCLDALEKTYDSHAVLVLQPTVEAFFLVHGDSNEDTKASSSAERKSQHNFRSRRLPSFHTISDTDSLPGSPAPFVDLSPVPGTPSTVDMEAVDPYAHLPQDTARFLKFADRHRTVLNQILRQSTVPLSEGPFAVLVNHTRLLDFDVKRRYFRQELEQMDEGMRREDLVVHVRRDHVFEDSFRELYRRSPEEMKANLYITFEGEEGQDAGGLIREWYLIIAREMFNPNYVLFKTTPGDRVTYMPNSSSHINPNHLNYFKFIGRIIAKAIYDNKLLDCYFTRSFYKHILGKPVHYTDMEAEDYAFYQGMVYLLTHDLNEIGTELNFTTEIEEFGQMVMKELKADGQNVAVTETNKREYVQLACQMKMTGSIRSQIKSFLEGFYEVIPKSLISIFNEQELELLISGLPTIDIDDLKGNTEYHKYSPSSLQIQWFWRALRSFDQADRARFLQFVTGTSKVPLQGFVALEGMNGIQKFQIHRDDRSTERLPCAHTCFNQLDLPPYETYDKLHQMLLTAIRECPEGFGFA